MMPPEEILAFFLFSFFVVPPSLSLSFLDIAPSSTSLPPSPYYSLLLPTLFIHSESVNLFISSNSAITLRTKQWTNGLTA